MPDFATVYERHFDYVWRVLRGLGVGEGQIEDAVQDAFVVVHRRLGEFEGRAKIETWLFAIARRVAQQQCREASQQQGTSAPLPEELPDRGAASPRVAAEHAQATEILVEILSELDEEKRAVLVLVELEEWTVPAAAEALGLKLNTAYSRLRLARRRFESILSRRRLANPGRSR